MRDDVCEAMDEPNSATVVLIDGTDLLDHPLGRHETAERWGLYGGGEAAGVWRGVEAVEGKRR